MALPKSDYPKLTSWSYSRYQTYSQCPLKARYKYIDKLSTETGVAAQRGTDIHALGEKYLMAKRTPKNTPKEFGEFQQDLKELREIGATPEHEMVFKSDWKTCTGWVSKDAWLRLKIDALALDKGSKPKEAYVVDFKTGKIRAEHESQVGFYALNVFLTSPTVEVVTGGLWYLDHPKKGTTKLQNPSHYAYGRDEDFKPLKEMWEANIVPMLNDTIYPAKPNFFCPWCDFGKANGGPCAFGEKR